MERDSLLKNIYLFQELSENQIKKIVKISNEVTYLPGDHIFEQGDEAHSLYVIKYGAVDIKQDTSNGDTLEVANLGSGSHFGEMSFLDGEKRSATVEVIEKSNIISIPYDKLMVVMREEPSMAIPFFHSLSKFLCTRLRKTTTDLSFARELNLTHF